MSLKLTGSGRPPAPTVISIPIAVFQWYFPDNIFPIAFTRQQSGEISFSCSQKVVSLPNSNI